MPNPRGNAVIGQSGGPTAVINQSLVGLIEACVASDQIGEVYGARRGIRGVLDEDFIDLSKESEETLAGVARTPCAALASIRQKPKHEDCERVLKVFRAHDVRYFFYIGGNDSAEAAHLLNRVAVAEDYELHLFHVPKTIDNDLEITDHCPGFGSAARFVTQALMGDNEDNRSLPGIKIDVIMGRHAGWLTAASRLARTRPDDGPHLIYVPERDFDVELFIGDVDRVYRQHGRCLVACSEGVHDNKGRLIAASNETDVFGNVQLSGSGALGDYLAGQIRKQLGEELRVRADTFGYLQRSFYGVVSEVDALEAREVARAAVTAATQGDSPHGSMVIVREKNDPYRVRYDVAALEDVSRRTKILDEEFIEGDCDISESFLEYVGPLVGQLDRPTLLEGHPVAKRLR